MSTEATNPTELNTEERKRLDREIMDMISALTARLTSLQRSQKPGSSNQPAHAHYDHERGVSIITMAGSNNGASMRSDDAGDRKWVSQQLAPPPPGEHEAVAPPEWATFINSNLQAINNSIMLETRYKSNDPGVHMDISEAVESEGHKNQKHGGRKGKAKAGSVSSYGSAPQSP